MCTGEINEPSVQLSGKKNYYYTRYRHVLVSGKKLDLRHKIWAAFVEIEPIAMHDGSSCYIVHVSFPFASIGSKTVSQPLLNSLVSVVAVPLCT